MAEFPTFKGSWPWLCDLRIRGHLPAHIIHGRGDSLWKWPIFRLSRARDLDLDLRSGHTAYRHALLIYLRTKFHWNRRNLLWTDGRTDIFIHMLLGRLGGVDLTRRAFSRAHTYPPTWPWPLTTGVENYVTFLTLTVTFVPNENFLFIDSWRSRDVPRPNPMPINAPAPTLTLNVDRVELNIYLSKPA